MLKQIIKGLGLDPKQNVTCLCYLSPDMLDGCQVLLAPCRVWLGLMNVVFLLQPDQKNRHYLETT